MINDVPECDSCRWQFAHENTLKFCTHVLAQVTARGGIFTANVAVQPECEHARHPTAMCGYMGRLYETNEPEKE